MSSPCNLKPNLGGIKGRAYICFDGQIRPVRRSELLAGVLNNGTPIPESAVVAFGITTHFDPAALKDPASVPPEVLITNGRHARQLVRVRRTADDLWSTGRRAAGLAFDPTTAALMDAVVAERTASPLDKDPGGWLSRYRRAPGSAGSAFSKTVHERWRARRKPLEFEPRIKADGSGGWVDIANTPFSELPLQWQDKNLRSAAEALEAVRSTEDLEAAAALVHAQWVERNRTRAQPELLAPYQDLPELEKEKDRDVVRLASRHAAAQDAATLVASEMHDRWRNTRRGPGWVTPYVLVTENGPVDVANDPTAGPVLERRRAAARAAEYTPQALEQTLEQLEALQTRAAAAGVDLGPTFASHASSADTAGALEDWCLAGAQIHAADAVIVRRGDHGDEVLMITRKAPPFAAAVALPGGMVDPGEDFLQAAVREMHEEVDLSADASWQTRTLGEVQSTTWDPRARHAHVGAVLFTVPGQVEPTAGDDASTVTWVPIERLASGKASIAFGHAQWLARAYADEPDLGPRFDVLAQAAQLRNTMLMREVNIERTARGAERIPL